MTSAADATVEASKTRTPRSPTWFRDRLTTTPGRLRLYAGLLAVAVVVFGLVAATAARDRQQATHAVATQTEPLLVQADVLYSSLSDADATATTTFLTGGLEPSVRRARYLRDLHSATTELTALAQEVGGSSEAFASVSTIATNLPLYSGEIETARTDNRQDLPVGAAYLRQASGLMRDTILPAAHKLYEVEARALSNDYGSGASTNAFVGVAAAALIALALVILSQLYLARLSNRVFNLPLVGATVALVALAAWALASFVVEQGALSTARRSGSDSVEVLSATRILLLRAQSDESLGLVARGGGDKYVADFDTVTHVLGPPNGSSGLLADAAGLARRTGTTASFAGFTSTFGRYLAAHRKIAAMEASGDFGRAVSMAVGGHSQEAPLASRLNADLASQIGAAQRRFEHAADRATSALGGLLPGIVLLTIGGVALVLFGVSLRIKEYR